MNKTNTEENSVPLNSNGEKEYVECRVETRGEKDEYRILSPQRYWE